MTFIPYRSRKHPPWLSHSERIAKLNFTSEELASIGVDRERLEVYVFSILTEPWRDHPIGARVIAQPSAHRFWIEEITEEEVERRTYGIEVKLTLAEIAQLPDVDATVANRIRMALGWEPRLHGGARKGGFEPGNQLASKTEKPPK